MTLEQRSVIWSSSSSCSAEMLSNHIKYWRFRCNKNTPKDPQSNLSLSCKSEYGCKEALQTKGTQVCEDFPTSSLSMGSSPAHVSASSRPTTNWFSHFLLQGWSTAKTFIHNFCLHVADHGLTAAMTTSICFHWSFIFVCQYFSIQSLSKESSPVLSISAVP